MKLFKRKLGKKQKAALNALADGIECGAKLRPQVRGGLVKGAERDKSTLQWVYGTCALGAAIECALLKQGKTDEQERLNEVRSVTDYGDILTLYGLKDRTADQPIKVGDSEVIMDCEVDAISTLIYRLNDQEEWTREQIAAFLRECE